MKKTDMMGVSGANGRGFGVEAGAHVVVGTMGKAIGTSGAYDLGQLNLIQYLWNRARAMIFSTASPPVMVAASRAALAIIDGREGEARRAKVAAHARRVREALAAMGVEVDTTESPIVPLIVGDDRRAVACSDALLERGWLVQAIRPPTVPEGTARLRIALSAAHSESQVSGLIDELARLVASGMAARR